MPTYGSGGALPPYGYSVRDPYSPPWTGFGGGTTNLQDQGRKFLTSNGSSAYNQNDLAELRQILDRARSNRGFPY